MEQQKRKMGRRSRSRASSLTLIQPVFQIIPPNHVLNKKSPKWDNPTMKRKTVMKVQKAETEKQENFNSQENNTNARSSKLENGLHSNGGQEASSSSETSADGEAGPKLITAIVDSANSFANRSGALDISNSITNRTQVHEIEVGKDENVTEGKVNIEEYDLEKILDEQETHDLYCPNCKSSITRRVILRKRKRTVRQALRAEPPKKPQIAEPSADMSNQTATEWHDQDAPEVFRCLSCFTFFIPTGRGFNIFRIFERRDTNQRVEVQHPSAPLRDSDNCGSWLLSCFQTVDSPKNSAGADPAKDPLLSGPQSINNQIPPVDNNKGSAHSYDTNGKTEQSEKPSPAGSSSMAQTSANGNEEIEQFHETTLGTIDTSSSTKSTISFSQNKTDIPQNTTSTSSDGILLFNHGFIKPKFKFRAIPTEVLPGANNLLYQKPTPVTPPPVQSESKPHVEVPIPHAIPPTQVSASAQRDEWDILKAIVYGGLAESITSLSVVSAAAASGAKTLDIFILGIANLIGGLPVMFHNIADLRNLGDRNENEEQVGHYWLQLGRRSKYRLHMVIAVLSYILFGLLPPVIYGLSFRKSDIRENKMMVVAAASLGCVALLAIGKAHVKRPRAYFTTVLCYLSIGLSGSGLSYVAGVLITRLLAHFGLIDQGAAPAPPGLFLPDATGAWASC